MNEPAAPGSTTSQSLRRRLGVELCALLGEIHVFPEIDSTNAASLRLLRESGNRPRLLLALSQTAGRGRRGRVWHSPENAGIYLSLTRALPAGTGLQALSLVTALAVLSALRESGLARARVKWPNDILVNDAKLAGVLLEIVQSEAGIGVIIGVGINRRLSAKDRARIDRPVTDLASELASPPADAAVIAAFCRHLLRMEAVFLERGFAPFRTLWNEEDCYLGREIRIYEGNGERTGRHCGVNDAGALNVRIGMHMQAIHGGEILPGGRPTRCAGVE
ncbi:MAG: biotin--[acetyl-CoA-carboxylase] ligase [Pseudohongiellaceae bacterium]